MTTETLNYIKALHMMNENCRKIKNMIYNLFVDLHNYVKVVNLFFVGLDLKIEIFTAKGEAVELGDLAGDHQYLQRLIEETEEIYRCIKLEDPKDMYANYAPPFKG